MASVRRERRRRCSTPRRTARASRCCSPAASAPPTRTGARRSSRWVAAGLRVVLWDYRGHGRSQAPRRSGRLHACEQVVDDLGARARLGRGRAPAVLGGLSFGGLASLHFALRAARARARAAADRHRARASRTRGAGALGGAGRAHGRLRRDARLPGLRREQGGGDRGRPAPGAARGAGGGARDRRAGRRTASRSSRAGSPAWRRP